MSDPATRPAYRDVNEFMVAQGAALRGSDVPPPDLAAWRNRRGRLVEAMHAAMGPFPEQPCDLEPKVLGTLKRTGYRIEKLVFQSRPDVWVTASAYVPESATAREKVPAVLVVHGHWAGARRDPVVQARCLGLVHLGFFVLAVDAFGAGERHPEPAPGRYHGALMGATLWPAGQSLLGMQVYDNRRAVDYLLTRPEVDGQRLGVTGASGGGNQTMYAGALDDRFGAVVPVCSVGTYQSYLKAACCVCEVLPGALRFTEEGDVLGLVAPRALMVVNATKDALQFSPGQAEISLARARAIYKLHDAEEKVRHAVFESPHAYNQPMREAMYGWMTKWLKGEGDGKPIPEPKHQIETAEDLACFPDPVRRPQSFQFPPTYAAREAKRLLSRWDGLKLDHAEGWDAVAVAQRALLRRVLGDLPKVPRPAAKIGKSEDAGGVRTAAVDIESEPGLTLPALMCFRPGRDPRQPACLLLHLDGKAEALKHPLAGALIEAGWTIVAPDLRGTGATAPAGDAIAGAPDHNSAEHAVWIGRPLLGQWAYDVFCLLHWLGAGGTERRRVAVVGLGQAGVVALCAAALFDDRVAAAAAVDAPATLVTELAYAAGTRMGLLAPGLFRAGDVPQLAALCAPRPLLVSAGTDARGRRLTREQLAAAYAFTAGVYRLAAPAGRFRIHEETVPAEIARWLTAPA